MTHLHLVKPTIPPQSEEQLTNAREACASAFRNLQAGYMDLAITMARLAMINASMAGAFYEVYQPRTRSE